MVNVPDLNALSAEVVKFQAKVDFWNSAVGWVTVLTAIAAFGSMATQRMVVLRTRALARAQAEKSALEAYQLAADLKEKDLKIAIADAKAAEANRAAEQERYARVQLENRLAWRRISPELHEKIVTALLPYAGSSVSMQLHAEDDAESVTFERDFEKALHDAHWETPYGSDFMAKPPPVGLICSVNQATPAGKALVSVLKKLPGEVKLQPYDDNKVMVGAIIFGIKGSR